MSTHYKDKQIPEIPEDILTTAKGIVYTVTNNINNKVYVGQTLSHTYYTRDGWRMSGIKERWRRHVSDSEGNKDTQFYKDIKDFGEDEFNISIYKVVPLEEIHTLNMIEFNAINDLNTVEPNGYNKVKWVNSFCFTKYIFMVHFNLLNNIPTMNKNTTSKDRAKQKCISQYNVLDFFSDKEIEEVYLRIINSHGNPEQARLVVKLKDEKDLYRTSWYIKKEPSKLLKYIKCIAETLKDDPFIDPKAKYIIEQNSLNVEVYKYQNRLDEASKFKFKNISGLVTEYKDRGFSSYLLILTGDGTKNIRYNFGGKTINIKEAYKQAKEFVDKLKVLTTIKNINLKELKSCPQQQATAKVANITFVE